MRTQWFGEQAELWFPLDLEIGTSLRRPTPGHNSRTWWRPIVECSHRERVAAV